jgi:hypothetical protein
MLLLSACKRSSTYSLLNEVVPEPGTLLEHGKE